MEVLGNGPEGQDLIQTVVTLTELPEELAHQEVDKILQHSGHASDNLTLEQLRSAMISYLEAMHADMMQESLENSEMSLEQAPVLSE